MLGVDVINCLKQKFVQQSFEYCMDWWWNLKIKVDVEIEVDVFSWLNGVWKLLGKSMMIGEFITIVWILLHSRCLLKCLGE